MDGRQRIATFMVPAPYEQRQHQQIQAERGNPEPARRHERAEHCSMAFRRTDVELEVPDGWGDTGSLTYPFSHTLRIDHGLLKVTSNFASDD